MLSFIFHLDGDSRTEEKLLNGREIDDETQSGCACERWLFIVIFMPIIIVFSVLGLLVWIVLWPGEFISL